MATKHEKFRVIIVGGSVAGLTLAHCLLKNNIDFVILESNCEIAPQVGASIGILPNGGRILDQLGIFDDILDATEPLQHGCTWSAAGKMISKTNAPQIIHERHGYPITFLDRQILLEVLYKNLKDGDRCVHTNKRVTRVEHLSEKVRVHCTDHSVFEGDIVVGADGVRSTVRREMWKYMSSIDLEKQSIEEQARMSSEYSCVFGISTATPGLVPGQSHRTFADGYSTLVVVGKEGRVFWFLFTKMDRVYSASEIPRFDKEDLGEHINKHAHVSITDSVTLSAVYQNVVSKNFLALEEAFYTRWCIDRFVCIGDSAHKMTPNMGQGGNSAIESAAALANHLAALSKESSSNYIPLTRIQAGLYNWQTARQPRAKEVWTKANGLTRLEAGATIKDKLIAQYLLPFMSHLLIDKMSQTLFGAEKLDNVPLNPRASQCSMPLHSQLNPDHEHTAWRRALWTAPLIGCHYVSKITMGAILHKLRPFLGSILRQGSWTASNGESLNLFRPIYNISFLDKTFMPLICCFLPSISGSDPRSYAQMISFMADIGPIYGIWLLESYRKGKSSFEVLLPTVMGIAFQLKGIGKIAPLYYAIEYIHSPLSSLTQGENRNIKVTALKSFLPAMLAGYYLPTFGNFFASTLQSRRSYNAFWQLFPIIVPLFQLPFYFCGNQNSQPNSTERQRRSKNNIFYVRCAYGTMAAISGLTFLYARISAPRGTSFVSIFFPSLCGHTEPVPSFAAGIATFLQYDELISMASGYFWLGLRFLEMKQDGPSWWKSVCALIGATITLGPGAAFALGWGWREEILAQKTLQDGKLSNRHI
ncbi:uncharacterized protein N7511_000480 [Penicillium nucicola]|uniref:uncharacterized protein n=1 Tax=Penicillium nucicola TaxID=1850975 RepID=UPI002545142A|nr:uncharacterized protein N7511_000480 [Penicillium nucicola]KAJ5775469.1 hypothetical protein N7511_000480 [Penicillium nucicola]